MPWAEDLTFNSRSQALSDLLVQAKLTGRMLRHIQTTDIKRDN